jgi:hypothetical protein
MNSNGTFSVGKSWRLNELRAVEVVNVSSCPLCLPSCLMLMSIKPVAFNITLARTYRWQTENSSEQLAFLHALVDIFRSFSNGPLQVIGLAEAETRSGVNSNSPI